MKKVSVDIYLGEMMKVKYSVILYMYQCYHPFIYFFSRQAGHRFGEHLEKMVPPIVRFCREEDDELREYCLQAFESFVRRCPKEISPFVQEVWTFHSDILNSILFNGNEILF